MAASAIRDEIRRQDARLQKDVSAMRELQSRAGALAGQAQGEAVRAALAKLADEFRFSDPVSNAATAPLEADLRACVDSMERALTDGDGESALELSRPPAPPPCSRSATASANSTNSRKRKGRVYPWPSSSAKCAAAT